VGKVLEKAYNCSALTIIVQVRRSRFVPLSITANTCVLQDGVEAGQTVPHVHVHLIPRKKRDYKENDAIYDDLDVSERKLGDELSHRVFPKIEDKDRISRREDEMATEAAWLATFFQ